MTQNFEQVVGVMLVNKDLLIARLQAENSRLTEELLKMKQKEIDSTAKDIKNKKK